MATNKSKYNKSYSIMAVNANSSISNKTYNQTNSQSEVKGLINGSSNSNDIFSYSNYGFNINQLLEELK